MDMWTIFFLVLLLFMVETMFITRVPELIPVILGHFKKMDYVIRVDEMRGLQILPARFDGNKTLTAVEWVGGKWVKTGMYQSRGKQAFSMLRGRKGIIAFSAYGVSTDPKVLAFIDFIKAELGIKTNRKLMELMEIYYTIKKASGVDEEHLEEVLTGKEIAVVDQVEKSKNLQRAMRIIDDLGSGYILSKIEYVDPSDMYDLMQQFDPAAMQTHEDNQVLMARMKVKSGPNMMQYIAIGGIILLVIYMFMSGNQDGAQQTAGAAASGSTNILPVKLTP